MNRRSIIKSGFGLAGAYTFSGLIMPMKLQAQTLPALSQAALKGAQSAVINLCNGTQSDEQNFVRPNTTSTTLASAVTALGILFGSMQETGFNTALTAGIVNGTLSRESIATVVSHVQQMGVTIPEDILADENQVTDAQIQQGIAEIEASGLNTVETSILNDLASKENASLSAFSTSNYDPRHLRAKLEEVKWKCAAYSLFAAVLGLFSPPPLDAIMGAISIYYAVESIAGVC